MSLVAQAVALMLLCLACAIAIFVASSCIYKQLINQSNSSSRSHLTGEPQHALKLQHARCLLHKSGSAKFSSTKELPSSLTQTRNLPAVSLSSTLNGKIFPVVAVLPITVYTQTSSSIQASALKSRESSLSRKLANPSSSTRPASTNDASPENQAFNIPNTLLSSHEESLLTASENSVEYPRVISSGRLKVQQSSDSPQFSAPAMSSSLLPHETATSNSQQKSQSEGFNAMDSISHTLNTTYARPQAAREVNAGEAGPIIIDDSEDEMNLIVSKDSRSKPCKHRGRTCKAPLPSLGHAPPSRRAQDGSQRPDTSATKKVAKSRIPAASKHGLHGGPQFSKSQQTSLARKGQDQRLSAWLLQQQDEFQGKNHSIDDLLRASAQGSSTFSSAKRTVVEASQNGKAMSPTTEGTKDNPIDLDSDLESDDPDRLVYQDRSGFRSRAQHEPEPMDIDGSGFVIFPKYGISAVDTSGDDSLAGQLDEDEKRPKQAPQAARDCVVCAEEFGVIKVPSLAACAHLPNTCATCYSKWVATQLQDSGWKEAKCPEEKCKTKLTYFEIKQMASNDVFQQYDSFLTRTTLGEDSDFRWCRACDSGQFHGNGEEGNIFTCASCGHKVCILHENTWHEGETCEEYEYHSSGRQERDQKAQEAASLAAIGKLSKKCPGKGCVYNIEKNDGCDHMTCSKCRYEFCWICLCDYNEIRRQGNTAHADSCQYNSKRLV